MLLRENENKIDYDMFALQSVAFTFLMEGLYVAQDYKLRAANHLPEGPFLVNAITENVLPAVVMGAGMAASRLAHHQLKKRNKPVLAAVTLATGILATSAGAAFVSMQTKRPVTSDKDAPNAKVEVMHRTPFANNAAMTRLPPKTVSYAEALQPK